MNFIILNTYSCSFHYRIVKLLHVIDKILKYLLLKNSEYENEILFMDNLNI